MAIKEVKAGEKYTLELLGVGMTQDKFTDGEWGTLELPSGRLVTIRPCDFEALSPTRQDVRSEHSTVGTLNSVERWEKLWNGMHDVLFENGTKNTDTAPKYDPNRKFRKGDKVRVVEYKGRNYTNVDTGKEGVVSRNETGADPAIEVTFGDDDFWDVDPAYLELVTPVEEQEPYYVEDGGLSVMVNSRINERVVCCSFHKNVHPNAKETAEAECARLNAEYRKEHGND
jgi:hypothetical protein